MGGEHILIKHFKSRHIEFEAPVNLHDSQPSAPLWSAAKVHVGAENISTLCHSECTGFNFLAHFAHSSQHELLASVGEMMLLAHQLHRKCFYTVKILFKILLFVSAQLSWSFALLDIFFFLILFVPSYTLTYTTLHSTHSLPFVSSSLLCCCTPITVSFVSFLSHLPMSFG